MVDRPQRGAIGDLGHSLGTPPGRRTGGLHLARRLIDVSGWNRTHLLRIQSARAADEWEQQSDLRNQNDNQQSYSANNVELLGRAHTISRVQL